jgi:hypothetical protein
MSSRACLFLQQSRDSAGIFPKTGVGLAGSDRSLLRTDSADLIEQRLRRDGASEKLL